jgi:hypothetical protein
MMRRGQIILQALCVYGASARGLFEEMLDCGNILVTDPISGDYAVGSEAPVGSYVECGQGALVDQLSNVGSRQSEQIGCLLG